MEKERTELVDFLLQIFERDDHSMGLKFLQMVEDNKYDLVMKFCRENVFGTTEGNPTEGSTVSYFLKFRQNYLFLYEFTISYFILQHDIQLPFSVRKIFAEISGHSKQKSGFPAFVLL